MKDTKGYTLIEMLFVVTLVGIGIILFSAVFFAGWVNYEVNLTRLNLQSQLDSALTMLEEDVMEADAFPTLNGTTGITLTYPDASTFPVQQITYQINTSNGDLVRTLGPSPQAISPQILISGLVDTGVSRFYEDKENQYGIDNVLVCELTLKKQTFAHWVIANGQKKIAARN